MFWQRKVLEDIKSGSQVRFGKIIKFTLNFIRAILIIVIVFIIISFCISRYFDNKIMPSINIFGTDLKGLYLGQVNEKIQDKFKSIENIEISDKTNSDKKIILNFQDKYKFIDLNKEEMAEIIWTHNNKNFCKIIYLFSQSVDLQNRLYINTEKIENEYVLQNSDYALRGGGDASVVVDLSLINKFTIIPEKKEIYINEVDIKKEIKNILQNEKRDKNINLNLYTVSAKINKAFLEKNVYKFENIYNNRINILLFAQNKLKNKKIYKNINEKDILNLTKYENIEGELKIEFDEIRLKRLLSKIDLANLESASQEPKFELDKNGKLLNIKKEINGKVLDYINLAKELNEQIDLNKLVSQNLSISVEVKLKDKKSEKNLSEINPYGISEILGIGYSSMRNSAPERFNNIKNGIEKLQGQVIPAGAEFSTIKSLSPFTEENGYVQGLAIIGKKIVPEIGGGMCQVSTTLFRAAMNSGLKITDRTNHSVVVNYYNDTRNNLPGTDATIYEPAPDFKFKNDTKYPVLVETKVYANGDIYMYLWGVSDGREGKYSSPQIFAKKEVVKEEPLYEPSLDIEPGKTVCSGPFAGMSAVFTYTRTLNDGKIENTPYYSYYRPQRMNCLVGYEFDESQ